MFPLPGFESLQPHSTLSFLIPLRSNRPQQRRTTPYSLLSSSLVISFNPNNNMAPFDPTEPNSPSFFFCYPFPNQTTPISFLHTLDSLTTRNLKNKRKKRGKKEIGELGGGSGGGDRRERRRRSVKLGKRAKENKDYSGDNNYEVAVRR